MFRNVLPKGAPALAPRTFTLGPTTGLGYRPAMATELVRFGVAMESDLLEDFDDLAASRGSTRSEVLRALVRAEVGREKVQRGVDAVAALTIVYDHHVRDLTERLTELQHELGDRVRSTLHVHLSHDFCLEVIVMHGRSDELQRVARQILATRGVKQGGIELITTVPHDHVHGHAHAHAPTKKKARRRAP